MTHSYVLRMFLILITGLLFFFAGNLHAQPEAGGQKQVFQLEEQGEQLESDMYPEGFQEQDDAAAQDEYMQPLDGDSYQEDYQEQYDGSEEEYREPEDLETYGEEFNEPSDDTEDWEYQAPLEEAPFQEETYLEEDHLFEDNISQDTEPISGTGQEIPDQQ